MINFRWQGLRLKMFVDRWWKPTQKEFAPILLKNHMQVPWQQEVDPNTGRPWQELSPKYAIRKKRRWPGAPILRASGKMQDTAEIIPTSEGFMVRTVPYGAYHQFGTQRMPARPWMGIPDESLKQLPDIAWKHILKG